MLVLRADPWMPEYGMGLDASPDEDVDAVVDHAVETDDWSRPRGIAAPEPRPLHFVDGVRRVELGVLATEGSRTHIGILGSYAAGCVLAEGTAAFGPHVVRRALVLGGGASGGRLVVGELVFEPESEGGGDRRALLLRLLTLMRAAEAEVARTLAGEEGCVVLADGPLAYGFYDTPTPSPVVGVIKRFVRNYLVGEEQDGLLAALDAGQRTPVFAIGDEASRIRRYAWYARLERPRGPFHERAGLVRCEVRAGLGVERAVTLADDVSALLPRYVGHPWEPRAPQNLAPIAALEAWLRHRLGDARVVRRRVLSYISSQAKVA